MAYVLRHTVNATAGTITFDLQDFVGEAGELPPGAYSQVGTAITYRIDDFPQHLVVTGG